MTDIAAHLTDHVVPFVPVRQFVLSFPHRLRYRLAYDHARCTAVLRIFMRAVRLRPARLPQLRRQDAADRVHPGTERDP